MPDQPVCRKVRRRLTPGYGSTPNDALIGAEMATVDGKMCQDHCPPGPVCYWKNSSRAQRYFYFNGLSEFHPFDFSNPTTIAPLGRNEMRITFMGSAIPPPRKAQQMMSVFVEVGWDGCKPLDQFVFDAGTGVVANYDAMNVGFSRMDKIFLTHLHGDHLSDVTHIYDFGPSGDRKSPLYIWGPTRSHFVWTDPRTGTTYPEYRDGTADYCLALRQANRWHTESFSFQYILKQMTPKKYALSFNTRKKGVKWRRKGIRPQRGGLRAHDVNGVATKVSERGRLPEILSATTVARRVCMPRVWTSRSVDYSSAGSARHRSVRLSGLSTTNPRHSGNSVSPLQSVVTPLVLGHSSDGD